MSQDFLRLTLTGALLANSFSSSLRALGKEGGERRPSISSTALAFFLTYARGKYKKNQDGRSAKKCISSSYSPPVPGKEICAGGEGVDEEEEDLPQKLGSLNPAAVTRLDQRFVQTSGLEFLSFTSHSSLRKTSINWWLVKEPSNILLLLPPLEKKLMLAADEDLETRRASRPSDSYKIRSEICPDEWIRISFIHQRAKRWRNHQPGGLRRHL